MLRVGIVGLGFMGMVHFLSYRKIPGCRVVALCDRHPERLRGDWTAIKGNFGPRGQQVDLAGIATFARWQDMLVECDLDLVDVTLPTTMHAESTIAALGAGRHVVCEKPISLDVHASDQMLAAAKKADRRLYVAHVVPYFPEFAWALAVVRSGKYGALRGAALHRLVADPLWIANFWSDAVGGPLFDLHVHDAHYIRLLFGMPTAVECEGTMRGGQPELWETRFRFDDPALAVSATSGVASDQSRSFHHGFKIELERASLEFDFAVIDGVGRLNRPPCVRDPSGRVEQVDLGVGDPMLAFENELTEVVRCASRGVDSEILNGLLARDAVEICHIQMRALQSQVASE